MAVTDDIAASYLRPRAVIRRKLQAGVREDRALATLIGASALIFLGQWPGLARAAHLDPSQPLDARMAGALLGTLFLLPPLAYGIAGLSHLAARALGGRGSYFAARLALFWALLAVAPVMLLQGLMRGFLGDGAGTVTIGVMVLGVFLWIWGSMLAEAERG